MGMEKGEWAEAAKAREGTAAALEEVAEAEAAGTAQEAGMEAAAVAEAMAAPVKEEG